MRRLGLIAIVVALVACGRDEAPGAAPPTAAPPTAPPRQEVSWSELVEQAGRATTATMTWLSERATTQPSPPPPVVRQLIGALSDWAAAGGVSAPVPYCTGDADSVDEKAGLLLVGEAVLASAPAADSEELAALLLFAARLRENDMGDAAPEIGFVLAEKASDGLVERGGDPGPAFAAFAPSNDDVLRHARALAACEQRRWLQLGDPHAPIGDYARAVADEVAAHQAGRGELDRRAAITAEAEAVGQWIVESGPLIAGRSAAEAEQILDRRVEQARATDVLLLRRGAADVVRKLLVGVRAVERFRR